MNTFTYINSADSVIITQLLGWDRKIEEYVNLFYEGEINRTLGTQFGDCIAKVGYLAQRTIEQPQNFRGVRDGSGRLQAGAIVLEDGGYLYQSAEPMRVFVPRHHH